MNAPIVDIAQQMPSATGLTGGIYLRVYHDIYSPKALWEGFEETASTSVYQSYAWCAAWVARVGEARNITPLIVTGENSFGQLKFILPLQLRSARGFRIIEALTMPQAAYGGALFEAGFAVGEAAEWLRDNFEHVIAALPKHDVFTLANVPTHLLDSPNPFMVLRHFASANRSHIMRLQTGYQSLLQTKRSSNTRRALRQRDQALEQMGSLIFDLPLEADHRRATLEVMFEQQKKRLSEFGVFNVYDETEEQFFFDMVNTKTSEGFLLQPYRLQLNGEVLAVMLGAFRHNTFWALISSLGQNDLRKLSPGDYSLRNMIASLCRDGTSWLDFSAGDTAYKFHWSDQQIQLNLIVRANSVKGLFLAMAMLVREKLKRVAKTTPFLNDWLFELRRKIRGRAL